MARIPKSPPGAKPTARRVAKAAVASAAATTPKAADILPPTPSASFGGSPGAIPGGGFQRATSGDEQKGAWARSAVGSFGIGYGVGGPYAVPLNGGRSVRDQLAAMAVANDIATSNPLIATAVLNLTTQAVGTGLTLSAKPDAEALGISDSDARALSDRLEKAWARWANNPDECDWAGRHTLHQLAAAWYQSYLLNGESVAVFEWKRFAGNEFFTKLKGLDSTQIARDVTLKHNQNVDIWSGVGFVNGRLHGYALRDQTPLGALTQNNQWKYEPARTPWGRHRILHVYQLSEFRQIRGLSPLVGGLTPAHEENTLTEFELASAMLQTQYALTVESALPPAAALDGLQINERAGNTETWVREREEIYSRAKITPEPGTINHLAPGDKLVMHRAQAPNDTYQSFDKNLTRRTAKAVGLAVEDIDGDYSQTSFSASRLAMALPHEINMRRRNDVVVPFYKAAYENLVEEVIQRDLIELPPNAPDFTAATKAAFCCCKFIGKGIVSPDPKKTAEANLMLLENGLKTRTDILAEDGKDLEQHLQELAAEQALLEKFGLNHIITPGNVTTQQRVQEDPAKDDPTPEPATAPKPPRKPKAQKISISDVIGPLQSKTGANGLTTYEAPSERRRRAEAILVKETVTANHAKRLHEMVQDDTVFELTAEEVLGL